MAMAAVDGVSPSLMEASGSTIASHVSICLRSFEDFYSHVRSPQNQASDQLELSEITDQLGRFRIWAGNIGAHRKGRSSLDYRLRDASHIKKKVQTLLEDLNGVISRAMQIIRGERVPWDKRKAEPDSDSDVTDSESEDEYSRGETELRQLMTSVHDTITFLLRLSTAIRNPAPHDQYMSSAKIDTSHFQGFDVKHVGDKFPKVSEGVAVILGKAISRRREYFRYRESHNKKLSDGLITEVVLRSGQSAAPEANQDSRTEIVPQSTVASSIPQEVKADNFYLDLEEDQQSESGFTQTSFATSAGGFQELKVPPMPREARDGSPFPCPFCFMIISVGSKRSWKKHVFKDLQPYTCTFPSCSSPHRLFDRRHEWFQHELQLHRRVWHCIEGCQGQFNSQTDFEIHIKGSHPHFDNIEKLQHLVTVCLRKPSMDSKTDCSFCDREDICVGDLEKHLGKHQEQLALFALPTISSDEGNNGHDSDAEDAGSAKSIHSVGARLSYGFSDDESISEVGSQSEIPEDQRRGSRDFVAPNSCPHFQSGNYVGSFRQCTNCLGWICNDCLNSGPACVCAYCSAQFRCSVCFDKTKAQSHFGKAVGLEIAGNDKSTSSESSQQPELNVSFRSGPSMGLDKNSTQTNILQTAPVAAVQNSGETSSTPIDPATTDDALPRRSSVSSSASTTDEDDAADDSFDTEGDLRPAVPTIIEWLGPGEKVYVTGTFAEWNKKFRLYKSGPSKYKDAFSATILLQPGIHHLKFLVDDEMLLSPELPTAVDFNNIVVNYLEVSPDDMSQELRSQPTVPFDIPNPPHQQNEQLGMHIPPDVYPPQDLPRPTFQQIPHSNPSDSGTPAPAASPEPVSTQTVAGESSQEVPSTGVGYPYSVFVVEDANNPKHLHRFPMLPGALPDVDRIRRVCHHEQKRAEELVKEAQRQFLDNYLERERNTATPNSKVGDYARLIRPLLEWGLPPSLVIMAIRKHDPGIVQAVQDFVLSVNYEIDSASRRETDSASSRRTSTGSTLFSLATLDAGDVGSVDIPRGQEEEARGEAADLSDPNPEPAGRNSSSSPDPARIQRAQTFTIDNSVRKRYTVTRKHPMSLISSSISVLVFKDEYLDIVPSKAANSNAPSIQKTISANFSEVVGSKVASTHPRSFKVVIYRGQRSTVYDFEASSAEEAAEIVKTIRDSIERCQNRSQRAINNIEAEISMPAGETEE